MARQAPTPETIEKLCSAVYPSCAMVAGMQLDVFTAIKDSPLSAEHLAQVFQVHTANLTPLLYALVAAGLWTVDGDRIANTLETDYLLVRDRPAYRGGIREGILMRWRAALQTAEMIRTGSPQAK